MRQFSFFKRFNSHAINLMVILAAFFVFSAPLSAQDEAGEDSAPPPQEKLKFSFKYKKDDSYRILSRVEEKAYFNGEFNNSTEILNRISIKVTGTEKGSGIHEATFMTSENSTGALGGVFSYGEDYKSVYRRDARGKYQISDKYYMPVVRDLPIFPDREIEPGEKWTAEGYEAHDFRRSYNIRKPYKIPFKAQYEYLGAEQGEDEKVLYKFDVKYTIKYSVDPYAAGYVSTEVPVQTQGSSHQTIFWDAEKGCIDHYSEEFKMVFVTSFNNVIQYEGTSYSEVTDFKRTANEQNVAAVIEKIEDLGISDVSVTAGEKGLTLSVENIQFMPESDILVDSEKVKLNKIAEILKAYPDNDLLITGHTALSGTAAVRQRLSEQRAQAVADYFVENNVRDKYHIFTKGMGAEAPIADNSTEAGRAKNRRVEITIMDE